jgi:TIR domain
VYLWSHCFSTPFQLSENGHDVTYVSIKGQSVQADGRVPAAEQLARVQRTISACGTTLVVLDRHAVALSSAWILFEVSVTDPDRLHFLAPTMTEDDLLEAFMSMPSDWQYVKSRWPSDKQAIREHVEKHWGSFARFKREVRIRLMHSSCGLPLLEHAMSALDQQREEKAAKEAAASRVAPTLPMNALSAPDSQPAQIMLSYRVPESGDANNGGDGWVFLIRDKLRQCGFSVFVGESGIAPGQDWAAVITAAVRGCEVFVPICSPTYGATRWTKRELQMADRLNKKMVPIWHSGTFPPDEVDIYLGGSQRIPTGKFSMNDARAMQLDGVVLQLTQALASQGCFPQAAPDGKRRREG